MRSLLFTIIFTLALPVFAQWQQDKAIDVVSNLLDGVVELVARVETQSEQVDAVVSKRYQAATIDLKSMRRAIRDLKIQLAGGVSKNQSRAHYENIVRYRKSIVDYAEGSESSQPVKEQVDALRPWFDELDVMYAR